MRTPLFAEHQKLAARMVDFNGWTMPLQYATIAAEHRATREKCGIFDTCHMGEFHLRAPAVRAELNRLFTGDFQPLAHGRMRYSFITDDDGGVIDDVVVFLRDEQRAVICVNAGDISGDFAALEKTLSGGATLTDASASTAKLDIQGAEARELIKREFAFDFFTLPFYAFAELMWRGEKIIVARSGYTGSPGVEIFASATLAAELWRAALTQGATPCGLGARDTLRLEASLPLYGHELSRASNPLDAGFARFVALAKPENFRGKAALQAIAQTPSPRQLRGLKIIDKRIPRAGDSLVNEREEIIGAITSGAPAWTLGYNVAFAYLETRAADAPLFVKIREKNIPAAVVAPPFYQNSDLRKKI